MNLTYFAQICHPRTGGPTNYNLPPASSPRRIIGSEASSDSPRIPELIPYTPREPSRYTIPIELSFLQRVRLRIGRFFGARDLDLRSPERTRSSISSSLDSLPELEPITPMPPSPAPREAHHHPTYNIAYRVNRIRQIGRWRERSLVAESVTAIGLTGCALVSFAAGSHPVAVGFLVALGIVITAWTVVNIIVDQREESIREQIPIRV